MDETKRFKRRVTVKHFVTNETWCCNVEQRKWDKMSRCDVRVTVTVDKSDT